MNDGDKGMDSVVLSSIVFFLSTAYFSIITYEIYNLRKEVTELTSKLYNLIDRLSSLEATTKDLRHDVNDLYKKVYELSEKVSRLESK